MIEHINLLLLLTMFGLTFYVYYRVKNFFYLISIMMDSEILDQLTILEKMLIPKSPSPREVVKRKLTIKYKRGRRK